MSAILKTTTGSNRGPADIGIVGSGEIIDEGKIHHGCDALKDTVPEHFSSGEKW
jgi:hypothetical protein